MTEDCQQKRPEFTGLPIYEEADSRCDGLLLPRDQAYDGSTHEAVDEDSFLKLLQDERLQLKRLLSIRRMTFDLYSGESELTHEHSRR